MRLCPRRGAVLRSEPAAAAEDEPYRAHDTPMLPRGDRPDTWVALSGASATASQAAGRKADHGRLCTEARRADTGGVERGGPPCSVGAGWTARRPAGGGA